MEAQAPGAGAFLNEVEDDEKISSRCSEDDPRRCKELVARAPECKLNGGERKKEDAQMDPGSAKGDRNMEPFRPWPSHHFSASAFSSASGDAGDAPGHLEPEEIQANRQR
jgi:hypothetical protein